MTIAESINCVAVGVSAKKIALNKKAIITPIILLKEVLMAIGKYSIEEKPVADDKTPSAAAPKIVGKWFGNCEIFEKSAQYNIGIMVIPSERLR